MKKSKEKSCSKCCYYQKPPGYPAFANFICNCKLDNVYYFKDQAANCDFYNMDLSEKEICYNCISFLGGHDWGLSCKEEYHRLTNATSKGCEKFKRREK